MRGYMRNNNMKPKEITKSTLEKKIMLKKMNLKNMMQ